ncbi:MAG: hypothetical protein IMZ59_07490 [Actinobacteria bacterium]|nr:hypothetical protein [Actinomycetota bacterium]
MVSKTINTLRQNEAAGKDAVIICSEGYYVALDYDEGFYYAAFLEGETLLRFRRWITEFRKSKYRIVYDP